MLWWAWRHVKRNNHLMTSSSAIHANQLRSGYANYKSGIRPLGYATKARGRLKAYFFARRTMLSAVAVAATYFLQQKWSICSSTCWPQPLIIWSSDFATPMKSARTWRCYNNPSQKETFSRHEPRSHPEDPLQVQHPKSWPGFWVWPSSALKQLTANHYLAIETQKPI